MVMRPCIGPVSPQPAGSRAPREERLWGEALAEHLPFSLTFGLPPVQWVFLGIPASEVDEAGTCGDWLGIRRREPRSYSVVRKSVVLHGSGSLKSYG